MTAQNHSRRAAGMAGLLGILLAAGLVPGAHAADPVAPTSRLESPMADLAVLDPPTGAPADTTPSLLVLDAEGAPVWRATGVPSRDDLVAATRSAVCC